MPSRSDWLTKKDSHRSSLVASLSINVLNGGCLRYFHLVGLNLPVTTR